jgi:hypothetical protein
MKKGGGRVVPKRQERHLATLSYFEVVGHRNFSDVSITNLKDSYKSRPVYLWSENRACFVVNQRTYSVSILLMILSLRRGKQSEGLLE